MKKNFFAVLIGVNISLLLFGGAEVFFRFNQKFHWISPPIRVDTQYVDWNDDKDLEAALRNSSVYNWHQNISEREGRYILNTDGVDASEKGNLACCVGRYPPLQARDIMSYMWSQKGHQLIYQAHFTFDDYNRRITPDNFDPDYNILMFGDSFTEGEGVNNEESAPYQLGLMRPQAKVYNMGTSASGPNDFLLELSLNPSPRLQDLKTGKYIVIYTYMNDHLERLFCRSNCLKPERLCFEKLPYYAREDDQIVFKGFFDKNRKFRNYFYELVNASAFLDFYNVVWPTHFTQEHFDFFADLMLEAKEKAKKLLGDIEFYLAFYPGGVSRAHSEQLSAASEKRGIRILDYSKVNMTKMLGDRASIHGDGHPTPPAHFAYAYLLNRDLPKNPGK